MPKVSLWKEDALAGLALLLAVAAQPLILALERATDPAPDLRIISYTIQQSSPGERFGYERAPLPLTPPLAGKEGK